MAECDEEVFPPAEGPDRQLQVQDGQVAGETGEGGEGAGEAGRHEGEDPAKPRVRHPEEEDIPVVDTDSYR